MAEQVDIDAILARLYRLEEEHEALKARFNAAWVHGLADLATGHGNQQFGAGKGRLNQVGVEMRLEPAPSRNLMIFNDQFVREGHPIPVPYAHIAGAKSSSSGDTEIYFGTVDNEPRYARSIYNHNLSTPQVSALLAADFSDGDGILFGGPVISSAARYFAIQNGPLFLVPNSGDWAKLSNGMVWYRSDTHQFRGRRNNQSLNFLMEGDAAGGGGAMYPLLTDPSLLDKFPDITFSSSTTLTGVNQRLFVCRNFIVNAGVVLTAREGLMIICKKLVMGNGAHINCNGANATSSTGAAGAFGVANGGNGGGGGSLFSPGVLNGGAGSALTAITTTNGVPVLVPDTVIGPYSLMRIAFGDFVDMPASAVGVGGRGGGGGGGGMAKSGTSVGNGGAGAAGQGATSFANASGGTGGSGGTDPTPPNPGAMASVRTLPGNGFFEAFLVLFPLWRWGVGSGGGGGGGGAAVMTGSGGSVHGGGGGGGGGGGAPFLAITMEIEVTGTATISTSGGNGFAGGNGSGGPGAAGGGGGGAGGGGAFNGVRCVKLTGTLNQVSNGGAGGSGGNRYTTSAQNGAAGANGTGGPVVRC